MATNPISRLLNTISDALTNNPATLANLVLTGITVGLNVLLESELFDCPQERSEAYGYMFLIAPCIILLFANMLVIVVDWNPCKLLVEALSGNDIIATCFKATIPSITRVFVAPIVWLIVSFANTDYYVCAKVGPRPEKLNLTPNETKALEDRIAETKTESQIIAWALFIVMVFATFVVIALENCCRKSKSTDCFSRTYNTQYLGG